MADEKDERRRKLREFLESVVEEEKKLSAEFERAREEELKWLGTLKRRLESGELEGEELGPALQEARGRQQKLSEKYEELRELRREGVRAYGFLSAFEE